MNETDPEHKITDRPEACRIAIGNWFSVAATDLANPGGLFEAFHTEFYPSHGMALSFSAKASLACALASPQPLASLKPNDLAGGFVPNLLSKYLYLVSQAKPAHLLDNRDRVFDINEWKYGVK